MFINHKTSEIWSEKTGVPKGAWEAGFLEVLVQLPVGTKHL